MSRMAPQRKAKSLLSNVRPTSRENPPFMESSF